MFYNCEGRQSNNRAVFDGAWAGKHGGLTSSTETIRLVKGYVRFFFCHGQCFTSTETVRFIRDVSK